MVIWISQRCFVSKKLAERYVRQLITSAGICESVRALPQFQEILAVLRLHPEAEQKLKNMVDLRIRQNTLNTRALAIDVVQEDGSIVDISWLPCISPRPFQYYWNQALRQSIWPQKNAFKLANPTETCPLCEEKIHAMQVDHYEPQFAQLVTNFTLVNPMPADAETAVTLQGDVCFATKHREYEELWQAYHQTNARLRIICEHCNLTLPRV